MILYGITKEEIRKFATKTDDGAFYALSVGQPIEVTVIKKRNENNVLSSALVVNKLEDKFMIKYQPNNEILFDTDFVESKNDVNLVSCEVDTKLSKLLVGLPEKYSAQSGYLVASGVLSLNGLVEAQRKIYYCPQLTSENAKRKITLLSVGLKGTSDLFGFFLVKNERGIAVSVDDTQSTAVSVSSKTKWEKNRHSWKSFCIEDFFKSCKVKEVVDNEL